MIKHILLLLLILPSIAFSETRIRPDQWASKVIGSGLENFYRLDEHVYRSEQPDRKSFSEIEVFGIKEVLNLRQYHSDDDEAKNTKLVLHRVKMNAASVSYSQILQALRKIKNAKGPILIHCWHGSDRTGVVSASYRVVFQNWSKARAVDEMKNGGYGYHQRFYPQLVQMILNLDVKSFREELGVSSFKRKMSANPL